jgi:hypothetical protein
MHLRKVACLLALASLVAACSPTSIQYANPRIGLALSHPSDWKPVEKTKAEEGVKQLGLELSKSDADAVFEHLVFGATKTFKTGKAPDNANLMILAVPVPSRDCPAVNDPSFASSDTEEYSRSIPGGRLDSSRHVAVAGLGGASVEFTIKGRKMLQHRYWYCLHDTAVLIQTTSASTEGEAALAKILASVRITRQ